MGIDALTLQTMYLAKLQGISLLYVYCVYVCVFILSNKIDNYNILVLST